MTTARSPRIAAFEQAASEDPVKAVEWLQAQLEDSSGPLIDLVDGDPGRALVTFVWIGTEGPVSIQTPLLSSWSSMRISVPLVRFDGTDVWYLTTEARADISTIYQFVVDDPSLANDPWEGYDPVLGYHPAQVSARRREANRLWGEMALRSFPDPFNPERVPVSIQPEHRWGSVLTLPGAEPLPWYEEPVGRAGSLEEHQFTSSALGNERTVTVYTPPDFARTGAEYPLAVMLDGEAWLTEAKQYVAFDNLIAAGRIPPVVVAFVNNAPSDWPPGVLRAFEMNCNPDFTIMLADELVPMLRDRYNATSDPSRVVIAGASFGGLAAAYAGLQRSEIFGNVLACSPAAWWGYSNDDERFSLDDSHNPVWVNGEKEEPEWLIRQYAAAKKKPLRLWVDVGCLEVTPMMATPVPGLDYRASVRHFRTVLIAKGYDVTFYESPGGHDWPTFRRNYVKGLETLLGPRQSP